jgi:hypothetical protein
LTLLFPRQTIRRQFSFSTFEQNKTKQRDLQRATQSKDSEMRKISITLFSREFERVFLFPTQKKKIFHLVVEARSEKIKKVAILAKSGKNIFVKFCGGKKLGIQGEIEWNGMSS